MFYTNVFSYRDRRRLCEHAYQRTRIDLYRRRHELMPILRRHGLSLNLNVLKDHRHTLLPSHRHKSKVSLVTATHALDNSLDELQNLLEKRRLA